MSDQANDPFLGLIHDIPQDEKMEWPGSSEPVQTGITPPPKEENKDNTGDRSRKGRIRTLLTPERISRIDKNVLVLFLFLCAVVLSTFILPMGMFGRLFGTDEYTHLFHSQVMYNSDSLPGFYSNMGDKTANPDNPDNLYNYPFGMWFFSSMVAKVTGIPMSETSLIYSLLFVIVLLSAYYFYSDSFIKKDQEKILAILFFLSMPAIAMSITGFRPEIFTLPFVLCLVYLGLIDELRLRNIILMALFIFVLVISHTGSFIFLLGFAVVFVLLYSLIWGRFPAMMYILTTGMLFIYGFAVRIFPQIQYQYINKATLFLTPGNFLAKEFYIFFADDLSYSLYSNLFVKNEFMYAIFWSALIFGIAILFTNIHSGIRRIGIAPGGMHRATILPSTGVSKSIASAPIWIGPIHVFLSAIGAFFLDGKGLCVFFVTLLTTLSPGLLQGTVAGTTGVLREIQYLVIIIPIVSVLGFEFLLSKLQSFRRPGVILSKLFVLLIFTSFMLVPAVSNAYYNPIVSGEDYIIHGMTWLGGIGNQSERVVAYGYRTAVIFTKKDESGYGISRGYEVRQYEKLLRDIFFTANKQAVENFNSIFGGKYILTSDKVAGYLGGNRSRMRINSNQGLDKIYSGLDFGIYNNPSSYVARREKENGGKNSIIETSSTLVYKSQNYQAVLDSQTPILQYIGTPKENYLNEGFISEMIQIETGDLSDIFPLSINEFDREMKGNTVIYRGLLEKDNEELASIDVVYTFYPETIKREFILSADRFNTSYPLRVALMSKSFIPADKLVLTNGPERLERLIPPLEDSVTIEFIFQNLCTLDGERGICINYDSTAPYPYSVSYQGSVNYQEYAAVDTDEISLLSPARSLIITQYIAIGDEENAIKRIERQKTIELHQFPYGILPLVLIPDEKSTLPDYNLGTIRQMSETNVPYIASGSLSPPSRGIMDEGLRYLQMARYYGNSTNVVIFPISEPLSSSLSRSKNVSDVFYQWKKVIDSVARNDDIAVLIIRPEERNNPKYSEKFTEMFDYTESQGFTTLSPEIIADHFQKIQHIEFNSSHEGDQAFITVKNLNDEEVNGLTFRITLPLLENGQYRISNGKTVRTKLFRDQIILYVATDLLPGELKTIAITPDQQRKPLGIHVTQYPIEGSVRIFILDEQFNRLADSVVTIDGMSYTSDRDGMVAVDLPRGIHEVTAFKPGYDPMTQQIEVNGRLYLLVRLFNKMLRS